MRQIRSKAARIGLILLVDADALSENSLAIGGSRDLERSSSRRELKAHPGSAPCSLSHWGLITLLSRDTSLDPRILITITTSPAFSRRRSVALSSASRFRGDAYSSQLRLVLRLGHGKNDGTSLSSSHRHFLREDDIMSPMSLAHAARFPLPLPCPFGVK
jgi:hypothetical protein